MGRPAAGAAHNMSATRCFFLLAPGCRILDNLPIGLVRMREDNGNLVKTYERGFHVGFQDVSSVTVLGGPGCTPQPP